MAASYPKPDGQKVTRVAPKFDWVPLPAEGRQGQPPKLPRLRPWTAATRAAWKLLWASPQATAWDQTGRTLHAWAVLHHDLVDGERATAGIAAEMRNIEDRHGLNPKALLQLRWVIVDKPSESTEPATPKRASAEAHRRFKVVDPDAVEGP
jgi:hypothetical protein